MISRIGSVSLNDFRCFRDEQTVEFDAASSDLHVIYGSSGAGKTALCSAIRLVLFGARRELSGTGDISWSILDTGQDTPSATVRVHVDTKDVRYRVERTLTGRGPPDDCNTAVSDPAVSQYREGTWTADDSRSDTLARLAPPGAASLLLVDAETLAESPLDGWDTVVERLLAAGAGYRSASDDTTVTPEALWEEFCPAFEEYIEAMGLSERCALEPTAIPFAFRTKGTRSNPGDTALPIASRSDATQLALAMTLAAGDCAGVPQWFDCPLRWFDSDASDRILDGLEAAATTRQIVVLAHTAEARRGPDIRRNAATVHRLENTDRSTTVVRRCD